MPYDEHELPTRPDLPHTAARRCRFCGLVYGEHVQGIQPIKRATCGGLRRDFKPEPLSEADRAR